MLKGGRPEENSTLPMIIIDTQNDIEGNTSSSDQDSLPGTIEAYTVTSSSIVAAAIPVNEEYIRRRKRCMLGISVLLFVVGVVTTGTIVYFTTSPSKNDDRTISSSQEDPCPPKSICYPNLTDPSFDPQNDLCDCSCYDDDEDIEYYQHCTQTFSPKMIYMNIIPCEDTYVRNGTYSSINYGSDTVIEVKNDVPDRFRYGLLKFEISHEVDLNSTMASLFLRVEHTGELPRRIVTVKRLAPNNWTESNVTFDNFVPIIDKVGSIPIEIYPGKKGRYVEFDITDLLVNGEMLLLLEVTSDSHESSHVEFDSRESSAEYSPYIELISEGIDKEMIPTRSCPDGYSGKQGAK